MVTRPDMFTIRVTPEERQLIDGIAAREERTPSDAVRRILLAKAREMGITPSAPKDERHEAQRIT